MVAFSYRFLIGFLTATSLVRSEDKTSLSQDTECPENELLFNTSVIVEHTGMLLDITPDELEALEQSFLISYNGLTFGSCEQGFRTVDAVNIELELDSGLSQEQRRLQEDGGGIRQFNLLYHVSWRCRGCFDSNPKLFANNVQRSLLYQELGNSKTKGVKGVRDERTLLLAKKKKQDDPKDGNEKLSKLEASPKAKLSKDPESVPFSSPFRLQDQDPCQCLPPQVLDFVDEFNALVEQLDANGVLTSVDSVVQVYELEEVECETEPTPYISEVLIEHTGDPFAVNETEIDALQNGFLLTYNELNALNGETCDTQFLIATSVNISRQGDFNRRLQVGGLSTTRLFTWLYRVGGFCRGCDSRTNLFDDAFRRTLKSREGGRLLQGDAANDTCLCPVGAEERKPFSEEMQVAFNETVQGLREAGLVQNVDSTEMVTQAEPVECSAEQNDFQTDVIVELAVSGDLSVQELEVLGDSYQGTYNSLQLSFCDPSVRRVSSVAVEPRPSTTRQIRFATFIYDVLGTCRGCPFFSSLFDDAFRRLESSTEEFSLVRNLQLDDGQCFCTVNPEANTAPSQERFRQEYSQVVQSLNEAGLLPNVVDVVSVTDTNLAPPPSPVTTPPPTPPTAFTPFPTIRVTPGPPPTPPPTPPLPATPSPTPPLPASPNPTPLPPDTPLPTPESQPISTPQPTPPTPSPTPTPTGPPTPSPTPTPTGPPTPPPTPRPTECTEVVDISITLPNASTVNDVDIFLLLDDTGSFSSVGPLVAGVFEEIIEALQSLLPGVTLGYGVGRFEDYGGQGASFGADDFVNRPFLLNQPILTAEDAGSQATLELLISQALDRNAPGGGGDLPESAIAEGLFQVATGSGFDGDGDGGTTGIGGLQPAGKLETQTSPDASGDVPSFSTLDPLVLSSGSVGGAGYRSQALKLVLLATDICSVAAFLPPTIPGTISSSFSTEVTSDLVCSGTIGLGRYGFVSDALNTTSNTIENAVVPDGAGTVQGTVDALVENGIRVLGLSEDGGAVPPGTGPSSSASVFLSALARLTGAVSEEGDPLVFGIDGSSTGSLLEAIVDAVTAAAAVPIDVGVTSTCEFIDVEVDPPVVLDVGPDETASFTVTLTSNPSVDETCELVFVDVDSGLELSSIPVSVSECNFVVGDSTQEPTSAPTLTPSMAPSPTTTAPTASLSPSAQPSAPSLTPSMAPSPMPAPEGPFCIDFNCGDGYILRDNPETRPGNDRETCCIREGVCAGAPEGSSCSLGDIGSSLIPNPSFEEHTSCPTYFSQLDRAVDWVQATSGTSDYWIGAPTCFDEWRVGLGVPQQATDGDALVGSIKGADGLYYEYIGACLISPLEAGVEYTFNLDVAAATDSAIYGGDTNGDTELLCIPDCNEFQISGFGYFGDVYEILGTAAPGGGLEGGGDWKSITFVVTPTTDCPAIMFGPGLNQSIQPGQSGTYVIYDSLNLQEGQVGVCNADGECVPSD